MWWVLLTKQHLWIFGLGSRARHYVIWTTKHCFFLLDCALPALGLYKTGWWFARARVPEPIRLNQTSPLCSSSCSFSQIICQEILNPNPRLVMSFRTTSQHLEIFFWLKTILRKTLRASNHSWTQCPLLVLPLSIWDEARHFHLAFIELSSSYPLRTNGPTKLVLSGLPTSPRTNYKTNFILSRKPCVGSLTSYYILKLRLQKKTATVSWAATLQQKTIRWN